ncbi:MAG: hypothetical protein HXY20_11405 [Acidobacteria bacterium]|nr:hypothetical protein [Acidobacteriota bacterium]
MRDIMNDLADFWIELYGRVLDQVDVDLALLREDMAYKSGPLISPGLFTSFMLPAYRKITVFSRDCGIRLILVDSDGNIWRRVPLCIEGGVASVFPFQVMAGMNVVELCMAFAALKILGGLDKTALARGSGEIESALDGVTWMLGQRGYIRYADHFVPPDVPWQNSVYYRRRLNGLIDEIISGPAEAAE